MKLNKIILSFCVSILGLYSCSIAPTLSKFPVSDIRLGLNKSDVKKQCGFPFRSDLLSPKRMSDTGNLDNVGAIEQE